MLTVQDWVDAGYRAYRQKTHNLSDYLLQKCISDEKGKMFYINVWVYEHFNKEYFKNNPHLAEVGFSPEVQFQREGKATMDCSLILNTDSTVQEVEQEFYDLWVAVKADYYELFLD